MNGNSAMTSVNSKRVPRLFTAAAVRGLFKPGMRVLDYGCGRWPEVVRSYLKTLGVDDVVSYDPNWFPVPLGYHHDQAGNGYDLVCLSNVLNVIERREDRIGALKAAWKALRPGGRLLVTVYAGDGSGASGPSRSGCWQENRPLRDYLADELRPIPGWVHWGVFVSEPKATADGDHFNDGLIDIRYVREFNLCVAVNRDVDAITIGIDDNIFGPAEVLSMYRRLWDQGWGLERRAHEEGLKAWLLDTGANPEELEDPEYPEDYADPV